MQKHTKIYFEYFGIGIDDYVQCEACDAARASEVHHIDFKKMGGTSDPDIDRIENLVGVCRVCHNLCHSNKEFNELTRRKHLLYLQLFKDNPIEYEKRRGLWQS